METGPFNQVKRWIPLVATAAAMVVIIGIVWVTQPAIAITGDGSVSTRGILPEPPARGPTDTPTSTPAPTPPIVTPAGTESAPEFQGIVRWLNSEPLTMEEQRGKVVLIDFWTYS
jgi:hypothetical protein